MVQWKPVIINSAKEVMFSSALVCLLAELCKNNSVDFHKTQWKSGTWDKESRVDCVDNGNPVRSRTAGVITRVRWWVESYPQDQYCRV